MADEKEADAASASVVSGDESRHCGAASGENRYVELRQARVPISPSSRREVGKWMVAQTLAILAAVAVIVKL